MKRTMLAAALTALAACGGPQVSAAGAATSAASQAIYLWGEGLDVCGPMPIARGLAVDVSTVTIDPVQSAMIDAAAELRITDSDGNLVPVDQVSGRNRTRFPRTGAYQLVAAFADGAQVTRELTVVEGVGLQLGQRTRDIVTHGTSGDCTQRLAEDAATPALAVNQELQAYLYAADAQGRPLVGALELGFSGTVSARQRTPGAPLNAFTFTPTRAGTNDLSITDSELHLEQQLSLEQGGAPAVCPAP